MTKSSENPTGNNEGGVAGKAGIEMRHVSDWAKLRGRAVNMDNARRQHCRHSHELLSPGRAPAQRGEKGTDTST